eukprot:NODE_20437_length_798_cov_8.849478.p2 GENE.NODE_20437_length_798_cov_8.849478~~NODE_20437_length_798_cov_8.849478.p2  ORF type:complete len:100 (+),score=15.85 NODE_20437_length_798_cov_8.849478:386-685(+)
MAWFFEPRDGGRSTRGVMPVTAPLVKKLRHGRHWPMAWFFEPRDGGRSARGVMSVTAPLAFLADVECVEATVAKLTSLAGPTNVCPPGGALLPSVPMAK